MKLRICNCKHGHHSCECDGETGAKKLICVGLDCNEYVYSKTFKMFRCQKCYFNKLKSNQWLPFKK